MHVSLQCNIFIFNKKEKYHVVDYSILTNTHNIQGHLNSSSPVKFGRVSV